MNKPRIGLNCGRSVRKNVIILSIDRNDPDMLEVGNGMTPSEDRTHFGKEAITDSVANMTLDTHFTVYSLYDLWQKKTVGKTSAVFTGMLPAHDVTVLRLRKTQ